MFGTFQVWVQILGRGTEGKVISFMCRGIWKFLMRIQRSLDSHALCASRGIDGITARVGIGYGHNATVAPLLDLPYLFKPHCNVADHVAVEQGLDFEAHLDRMRDETRVVEWWWSRKKQGVTISVGSA
jgi:hypothetical protein